MEEPSVEGCDALAVFANFECEGGFSPTLPQSRKPMGCFLSSRQLSSRPMEMTKTDNSVLFVWFRFFMVTLLAASSCCFQGIGGKGKQRVLHRTPLLRCKTRHHHRSISSIIEDDGYSISNRRSSLQKLWERFQRVPTGSLILVRHGETVLNYNKTFTGWIDTDLAERGVREIEHAANLLLERGYSVDVTFTSRLKRAIRSTWILLIGLNQLYKPVYKSWRLNERMYGALEGKSKPDIARELGESVVQEFRAGLKGRPPPMLPDHPHWHQNERKYTDLQPNEFPITESLEDTMERTIPLLNSRIVPALKAGKNVMIVAHANSLRGIIKHIDNISEEDISRVVIPNGIPLVYKFDRKLKPIKMERSVAPLSGEFLEKKGLLRLALEREKTLTTRVPGVLEFKEGLHHIEDFPNCNESPGKPILYNTKTQLSTVLQGLSDLKKRRQLIGLERDASEHPKGLNDTSALQSKCRGTDSSLTIDNDQVRRVVNFPINDSSSTTNTHEQQVIVIIRHGKTEYNKLGIFTGWEDAPLIDEGRAEASAAGRLLKLHNIEFDAVYTSWLSRAIETAWIILDELDSLWLPIMKSWRLNERMYGALTGMSKSMIKEKHGEEQFKKWRRSYGKIKILIPKPKIKTLQ